MGKHFLNILIGSAILIAWSIHSEAATIYVRDNYKTIQEAVDHALPGDTIIVKDGEYRENIVISKPLTLKSDKGPDATVVRASHPAEPVFYVSDVSNAAIIGFTAAGSAVAGIYLNKAGNIEIRDNNTPNNRNGIFLYSSTNNVLTNNSSNSNDLTGIYLELSHNNTLEKNTANLNNEKGVFLNLSNGNKLLNNIANRNEWNGITLWASNNNRVEGNEILRNTYGIVESGSSNNTLNGNYTWTNFYIILPIILIYVGVLLYWIQRRIFRLIYSE